MSTLCFVLEFKHKPIPPLTSVAAPPPYLSPIKPSMSMRCCIVLNTQAHLSPPLLQAGEDALDRKRAAYLLQRALRPEELRGPAWSAWLTMYGLLEEFAAHLFKPAWGQVSTGAEGGSFPIDQYI